MSITTTHLIHSVTIHPQLLHRRLNGELNRTYTLNPQFQGRNQATAVLPTILDTVPAPNDRGRWCLLGCCPAVLLPVLLATAEPEGRLITGCEFTSVSRISSALWASPDGTSLDLWGKEGAIPQGTCLLLTCGVSGTKTNKSPSSNSSSLRSCTASTTRLSCKLGERFLPIWVFSKDRCTCFTLPKSVVGAMVYTTPPSLGVFKIWYTTELHKSWILCLPLTLWSRRYTNWPSFSGAFRTCRSCLTFRRSDAAPNRSRAPSKATCNRSWCSRTYLCTLPASSFSTLPSRKSTGSLGSCPNIKK